MFRNTFYVSLQVLFAMNCFAIEIVPKQNIGCRLWAFQKAAKRAKNAALAIILNYASSTDLKRMGGTEVSYRDAHSSIHKITRRIG